MTTPKFTLPFVWPSVTDLTSQARDGVTIPFDHALEDVTGIFGIVSDVNDRGARWLEESLTQKPDLSALVILAVYAGCPTRSGDLARLLDLQAQATRKVEFRILPMTVGVGAPANCLVAVRKDSTTPVFLFGPTPNFTIDGVDRTQVNMAFRTESVLFDRWRRWFDGAWLQAAELTATTADIPALVPATGTSEATAQWDAYCAICAKSEQPAVAIAVDSKSEEVQSGKKPDGSEDPPPTSILNLPKLDSLAIRMTRLFATGKQVTIAHSSAIRPLDAPVNPRLLGQEAEHRDGAVVQRQSFRVSVFSEEELKKINEYRKGSQAIIQKLGLRMETGIYWLPDKALSILEDEINMRNEEAKNELRNLVEGSADDFVGRKIEKIKTDLENAYRRLGGTGDVPKRAVTEVADSLQLRIRRALDDSRLVTPVTFSGVRFTLPNNDLITLESK